MDNRTHPTPIPAKTSRALSTNASKPGGAREPVPASESKIVPSSQFTTNAACRAGSEEPAAVNASTAKRRISNPPSSYTARNSGRRVASNANSYRASIRVRPDVIASKAKPAIDSANPPGRGETWSNATIRAIVSESSAARVRA